MIDCEHQAKEYFNQRRLSFISAISTIVATKMVAYNAEEERKEAEISLSQNLKKVSELEMKSLRSQLPCIAQGQLIPCRSYSDHRLNSTATGVQCASCETGPGRSAHPAAADAENAPTAGP